jgi:hypothetical protein
MSEELLNRITGWVVLEALKPLSPGDPILELFRFALKLGVQERS